jgi:hypothetical protein
LESWKCSCGIRCADHMSTQYRLVQSGKTASGGCSAGPRSVRACSARIIIINQNHYNILSLIKMMIMLWPHLHQSDRTYWMWKLQSGLDGGWIKLSIHQPVFWRRICGNNLAGRGRDSEKLWSGAGKGAMRYPTTARWKFPIPRIEMLLLN